MTPTETALALIAEFLKKNERKRENIYETS